MNTAEQLHNEDNRSEFEQTLQEHIDDQNDFDEYKANRPADEDNPLLNQGDDGEEEDLPEAAQKSTKEIIYSMGAMEFIERYEAMPAEDKKYLYDEYTEILRVRAEMNERMKNLKEWCEHLDRLIDFPTYKAKYKRANEPKKKQNMIDASDAYWTKELDPDYQIELWSKNQKDDAA